MQYQSPGYTGATEMGGFIMLCAMNAKLYPHYYYKVLKTFSDKSGSSFLLIRLIYLKKIDSIAI